MLEKNEMSHDETAGERYGLLTDAALDSIAAGFDDELAHLFAKKMLADMEKAGFGPTPEKKAAAEEYFFQAYKLVEEIKHPA
ncbi:hypothetical protein [Noviherbaspirillum soli]|uniref:hypothetical protein n=1 Tax=Noviherbaspirillum soli TaxID=1064518 RepID=UPI00188C875C|nr:hypothetical protein [Noviherbaspirillum soli]